MLVKNNGYSIPSGSLIKFSTNASGQTRIVIGSSVNHQKNSLQICCVFFDKDGDKQSFAFDDKDKVYYRVCNKNGMPLSANMLIYKNVDNYGIAGVSN